MTTYITSPCTLSFMCCENFALRKRFRKRGFTLVVSCFVCLFVCLFILPQSALRQLVQTLQEENTSLRNAVDRAPTAEKLSKLEKQISKPLVCVLLYSDSIYWVHIWSGLKPA